MNATEGRNITNAIWSWGAGDATASDDDDDDNYPVPFQALPSAVPDPPGMTQSFTYTTPTLTIRKTKNYFEFEDEGPVTPRTFLSKIMPSPVIKALDTLTKTQKKKEEKNTSRSQRQLSIRTSIRLLDINDCADLVLQNEESSATILTSNPNKSSPPAEIQDAETQDSNKEPLPEEEKVPKAKKSNKSMKEKKEKKEKDKKKTRKPESKTEKKEKKSNSKKKSSKEKSKTRRGSSDS
jgi:hypothetical protein